MSPLTTTITLLALAASLLGRGTIAAAALDNGGSRCLTLGGGNVTTSVFSGCCRDIALETYPVLALTASCPNCAEDYNTTAHPAGLWTASRLYLDQCLRLGAGPSLVTLDDVTPDEVVDLLNITITCEADNFNLTFDEDGGGLAQLRGTCHGTPVSYDLNDLILSHRGVLTCGGTSRGTPFSPLNETCCNLYLELDTTIPGNPLIVAACQTDRFRPKECPNPATGLDMRGWRRTTISWPACQLGFRSSRGGGGGTGMLRGHTQDCSWEMDPDDGFTLWYNCTGNFMGRYPLNEILWNEYGYLACRLDRL